MRGMHRSVAAALMAPMLLLAVSASGFVALRCRMTGTISVVTCCPSSDGDAAPAQAVLDDPSCCERLVVDHHKPPAAVAARPETVQPSPLTFVPVEIRIVFVRPPGRALDTAPPPPFRPPLRILNRSLLL